MIAILDALNQLVNNSELNDFGLQVLTDPLCELSVKQHLIEIMTSQDTDSRLSVIVPFFKFWKKSTMKKLSDNDIRIIQNVFYTNQDLIVNENYELWDLMLEACDKSLLETLFVDLINSLLENKNIEITETLLIQLFKPGNIIRSEFLETLALKQELSADELEMIKEEYPFNTKQNQDTMSIMRYSEEKYVPAPLVDIYQHLVRALSLGQELKNQTLPVLNFMPGVSSTDKYYLLECLAANHQYKLLSVNLPALLGSVVELTQLKLIINNSKPCLVYFHGFSQLINAQFNNIETSSIEILDTLFKEFKVMAGVNFLVDIDKGYEDMNNDELQACIKKVFHLQWGLVKDINKPDLLSRQRILNDHIKRLTPSRISSNAGLELIAKDTEDYSLVEFLAYVNSYMRFCLLIYGEIKSPSDLYHDLILTDDTNHDIEIVST